MRRVLVITRNFPPTGSVGSCIRLIKFIKYLSSQKWNFDIVTQDPAHPAVFEYESSNVLVNEIPETVNIVYCRSLITIPDKVSLQSALRYISAIVWGLSAFRKGSRLISTRNPDIIYAGMPHFVNGVIASLLSRVTGIPLIIDMKDDVVGGSIFIYKPRLRKALEQLLERFIFATSAQIVFATEQSMNSYRSRYPKKVSQFHYISNGCDLEEFDLPTVILQRPSRDRFLIMTAASRYRKDYRDAKPFLLSLARFLEKNAEAQEKIQVFFLGDSLSSEYEVLISQLKLGGIVRNQPSVERAEYRSWLKRADLLFLVQPYRNSTSTAGTLYEYWATGRAPILLFSESGSSRELIEGHQIGLGAGFEEIERAAAYIESVYRANQLGQPIQISKTGVDAFDRKQQAMKMGQVWEQCFHD